MMQDAIALIEHKKAGKMLCGTRHFDTAAPAQSRHEGQPLIRPIFCSGRGRRKEVFHQGNSPKPHCGTGENPHARNRPVGACDRDQKELDGINSFCPRTCTIDFAITVRSPQRRLGCYFRICVFARSPAPFQEGCGAELGRFCEDLMQQTPTRARAQPRLTPIGRALSCE